LLPFFLGLWITTQVCTATAPPLARGCQNNQHMAQRHHGHHVSIQLTTSKLLQGISTGNWPDWNKTSCLAYCQHPVPGLTFSSVCYRCGLIQNKSSLSKVSEARTICALFFICLARDVLCLYYIISYWYLQGCVGVIRLMREWCYDIRCSRVIS
jgi:hypothetical protein